MSKKKKCHCFSRDQLNQWSRDIDSITDYQYKDCLINIINPQDLASQLTAVKKVQTHLLTQICQHRDPDTDHPHDTDLNDADTDPDHIDTDLSLVVKVLVEIHSVCESRHSLQRTLTSVITAVWQFKPIIVEETILNTLTGLINEEGASNILIDYIQSLMEHYPPGGRVLHIILPQVIHKFNIFFKAYWTTYTKSFEIQSLLLSLLKVLLNILHFCNRLLFKLVESHDTGSCDSDDVIVVVSSKSVSLRPSEVHWSHGRDRNWLMEQLKEIQLLSATVLRGTDHQIARDTRMSVAMVTIVTVATLYPSSLHDVLPQYITDWLDEVYPPLSRLAIVHGLLAKLSSEELVSIQLPSVSSGSGKEHPLLVWLFPILTELMDKFTDSSDRYISSRTLTHWSTVLSSERGSLVAAGVVDVSPSGGIIDKLMEYIWSHWEDPIDAIRHQCRIMFENIVNIYVKLRNKDSKFDEYLHSLCLSLLSLSSPTRGKYSLLSTLSPHVSSSSLLSLSPSLPNELINTMGQQSLACKAGELWNLMITSHYAETDEGNWKQTWLVPLVIVLLTGTSLAKEHIKQYCIASVFKTTPTASRLIDETIQSLSRDLSCDPTDILSLKLICMRYKEEEEGGEGEGVEDIQLLETSLQQENEQVVSLGVRVLCYSRHTTDLPSLIQLRLIIDNIQLHMNSQSPSLREQTLSSLKKLFMRINDGVYRLMKEKGKNKQSETELDQLIETYKDFLCQLVLVCFETLQHPLDSFQRRYFSLSILLLMSELFQNPSVTQFEFSGLVPDPLAKGLVYVLWDSFESNRIIIIELMKTINKKKDIFTPDDIQFLSDQSYHLVTSPKYNNCSAGYHLLSLLIQTHPKQLVDSFLFITGTPDRGLPPPLALVVCLSSILDRHMTDCGRSLLTGSLNAPMYGVIQSIRGIWNEIDIHALSDDDFKDIKLILDDILTQCVSISVLVSPVVCNSSPEGYLPREEEEEGESGACCHGNSQSVLLCCWHCMKEIILLLTAFIESGQRKKEKRESTLVTNTNLLSIEQIDTISLILIQQLTQARHRGAFEMAYVGFSCLCGYLWTSPDPLLSAKPVQWIKDLIDLSPLQSLAQLLNITRRSAGLPFYCLAIVLTEPRVNSYTCLNELMSVLLRIASTHKEIKDETIESLSYLQSQTASIHSLNIMRSLVRESRLGEAIVPYLAPAIIIAVEGFNSEYWPVRNSCTLLFSSLISRVFGVMKGQDDNKMTNKEFFTRFPSLHEFLLTKLKESVTVLDIRGGDCLFPVLLLLSRLYPSQLDDNSSHSSLLPFQPFILRSTGSPVWKCRILSSHALLPTLTPPTVVDVVNNIISKLVMSDQNQLHGLLLMLSVIIGPDGSQTGLINMLSIKHVLEQLLEKRNIGKSVNKCPMTRGLFLHCITLSLNQLKSDTDTDTDLLPAATVLSLRDLVKDSQYELTHSSSSCNNNNKNTNNSLSLELSEYQFHLVSVCHSFFGSNEEVFLPLQVALLSWKRHPNLEDMYEWLREGLTNGEVREEEVKELMVTAVEETKNNNHYSYLLLSVLPSLWYKDDKTIDIKWSEFFSETITKLNKESLREEVKVSMIRWCSTVMSCLDHHRITHSLLPLILTLSSLCNDSSPILVRIETAKLLGKNWTLLHNLPTPSSSYWRMIIQLLQDVEADVRTSMITSIQQAINNKQVIDSSLCLVMCQQLCLRSVIDFISTLYDPLTSFSLLLSLLSSSSLTTDHETRPAGPAQGNISSLLFEEDRTNSYFEPAQLVRHVSRALKRILDQLDKEAKLLAENELKEFCGRYSEIDGPFEARDMWLNNVITSNDRMCVSTLHKLL